MAAEGSSVLELFFLKRREKEGRTHSSGFFQPPRPLFLPQIPERRDCVEQEQWGSNLPVHVQVLMHCRFSRRNAHPWALMSKGQTYRQYHSPSFAPVHRHTGSAHLCTTRCHLLSVPLNLSSRQTGCAFHPFPEHLSFPLLNKENRLRQ